MSPTSGTSHGEHDPITVTIDTTGLSLGSYTCEINIESNSGDGVFTAAVNIVDSENPILLFDPESYDFSYKVDGETDEFIFEIWNGGRNPLSYNLTEECNWVAVFPTNGSSAGEHDPIEAEEVQRLGLLRQTLPLPPFQRLVHEPGIVQVERQEQLPRQFPLRNLQESFSIGHFSDSTCPACIIP